TGELMRSAKALALGIVLGMAPAAHGQAKPSTAAASPAKPSATSAKPTAQAAAKPGNAAPAKGQAATPSAPAKAQGAATRPAKKQAAPGAAKPAPAKQAPKQTKKTAARPAPKKPVEKPASTEVASAGTGDAEPGKGARRDPFESLVASQQRKANLEKVLPPGKAGLQVSTLRLDGIVKSSNGMIAVVSNPQARTYFLREGDQLYDGRVEKIAMDGVSFHEVGKDAFGKPVERQVQKRIYSSTPGEQQ